MKPYLTFSTNIEHDTYVMYTKCYENSNEYIMPFFFVDWAVLGNTHSKALEYKVSPNAPS